MWKSILFVKKIIITKSMIGLFLGPIWKKLKLASVIKQFGLSLFDFMIFYWLNIKEIEAVLSETIL